MPFLGHRFFWAGDILSILFQVYMTVDSGYSTWRGKLMEAMVGPYLQLHKLAMAEGRITRCENYLILHLFVTEYHLIGKANYY